jgi:hypothetical protein
MDKSITYSTHNLAYWIIYKVCPENIQLVDKLQNALVCTLGQFDTNYIIFRIFKNFKIKKKIFQIKKYCEGF